MKRALEKDFYSILGVSPDATVEEMRYAYLARARVIHPDRFNSEQQAQDWKKANEMLAELNEAYSILRNATSRAQYDSVRAGKQHQQTHTPHHTAQQQPEPPPSPAFELGELTPGQVAFANLPKNVQACLLKRQQNKGEDQFQVKLSSLVRNYAFIVILQCWYWYLFADANGAKWEDDTLLWYAGFTLAVSGLIGLNCVTISRWAKARLKPYFYITPIYFIKTDFDIVSFRPIWTLKDVAVTHFHKNGSYKNSHVVLKFDGYNESLSFSSKEQVETLFNRMQTYDTRLRAAYANRDQDYFLKNDDFHRVPRSGVPSTVLLSRGKQSFIYITCAFLCGIIGLVAAITANEKLSNKRWVQHPVPNTYKPAPTPDLPILKFDGELTPVPNTYEPQPTPVRVVTPSYPEQPLPYSGESPRAVTIPELVPSYPEQPLPYSGSVRTWNSNERIAPFEINAAQGSHYLLKLVDAYTYDPVLTVFVRSGATVKVEVPLGTYQVRYASGDTWYGYKYLFGPGTSYSKADKTFTFEVVGNQISGFTITLYKVSNGNLQTSEIRPTEF